MTTHVAVEDVSKAFAGVQALAGVSVEIYSGCVHALVGENGAGKSTLGKIIAGALSPDTGRLIVDGSPVSYRRPHDALSHGITIIAQELALVPRRSVLENVFLGREKTRAGFIEGGPLRARFAELNERTGFDLDPDARVGDLRIADQQRVEIMRALAREARLIVMDEPTAALGRADAERLLDVIRDLKRQGKTIVYISHFLDEVLAAADTVTVMRDARVVRTAPIGEESAGSLVHGMLGRSLQRTFPPKSPPPADAPTVLSLRGLTRAGGFTDISFDVREGEIVTLAGLVGSGRSEVARAVFGADGFDQGEIHLDGRRLKSPTPRKSYLRGIAMVPERRKEQGLIMRRSVRENITLPHLRALARLGWVSRRKETREVREMMERIDIRAASPSLPVAALSGGNQQKALYSRCLFRRPRLLIADEPTRGVDVGAKRALYDLIARVARQGTGVLLISSEIEEVVALSHRVLVMRMGRLEAEYDAEAISERNVLQSAFATPVVAT